MTTVHIVEIESALEAQAIRAVGEAFGAVVSVTWVGNSGQVVDFLASRPAHDIIILSAHGDERGILLPELAPSVRANYPYGEVIRPDDFAQFVALAGNGIIASACCGGQVALAEAFLTHGAAWYIGAEGYPDGDAALVFVLDFLYHFRQSRDVAAAFARASHSTDGATQFRLFEAEKQGL